MTATGRGIPRRGAPEPSAPERGAPEHSAPEHSALGPGAPEPSALGPGAPEPNASEPSAPEPSALGPGWLARELGALLAIAQRDLVKLLRDRPRLAVNLAFPVLLVAGLGSVLQPTVGKVTGVSAVALAFTGVLPATLFQSTAAGMISIAEDRETDFSRTLFVAPVTRLTLVTGKIFGETLVALFQGGCVVAFAAAIGVRVTGGQLAALVLPALACCLLGGAFGLVTMAALPSQRSAMDVFQFLIIPQYVLGGVLVPLHGVPRYLDVIAGAMPLRYAVDLVRGVFFDGTPGYRQVVTTSPGLDAAVIGGVFAAAMTAGALIFEYRERTR